MSNRKAATALPADPTQALQRLIRISQALLDLSERETQALVQNDLGMFAVLQDEKEMLTGQYTAASEEFRSRIEDFRTVDRGQLLRLEGIQKALSDKMHGNSAVVANMRQRAGKNAHSTLLTAQELGQQKPFRPTANDSQQEIL